MSPQCPHMARVTGFGGIRMCQRRVGHEGPHGYLIGDDEVACTPFVANGGLMLPEDEAREIQAYLRKHGRLWSE